MELKYKRVIWGGDTWKEGSIQRIIFFGIVCGVFLFMYKFVIPPVVSIPSMGYVNTLLCLGGLVTIGIILLGKYLEGDDTRHSLNPEVQGILNILNDKK